MNSSSKTARTPLKIDLRHTFIRKTDFSDANLDGADLSYADCENTIFRRVNFKDAVLDGTNLKGADLTDAQNLTQFQIGKAITDSTTILPMYLRS